VLVETTKVASKAITQLLPVSPLLVVAEVNAEQGRLDMSVLRILQTEALQAAQTILVEVLALLVKVMMEDTDTRTASTGQLRTTQEAVVVLVRKDVTTRQINIRQATEEMVMVVLVCLGMVLFMQAVVAVAFILEATPVQVVVVLAAVAVVVK
jgi:hypothetical protein